MAEGGHLAKTIDGSEIFYDFNCSVCIRDKGVHSEAWYYCPSCNKYYCKNCFIPSGCDHDTIGRGNVDRWGTPSVRLQFDECPMHKTNTIQLYCEKDDVVCCAVCGQAHHKSCGDLKYIPSIASGTENKKLLKNAETELKQLQSKVELMLKEKTANLGDLDSTATKIKAEIRKVKEKIILILENLEQSSLNELDKLKIDCQDKIKSEILFLNNTKAEVLELVSKLRKHNVDEALLFSRLKQSKEMIQEKKLSLSDIASSRLQEKVSFESDTKVLDCIKSLQGLGVLVSDTKDNQMTQGVGKESKGQGLSSLKLNKPYKVTQRKSFDAKIMSDMKLCNISGMCQLPGGNIMVADYNNKRLKQLDHVYNEDVYEIYNEDVYETYKVIGHCDLSAGPNDVCNTEKGEVAVALHNTIQFVSVGDTLTATRSFSTHHGCYSLAYHNKCLYVISYYDSTVYVYTPSGSLQHTISTDQHGTELFSGTRYITVSPVSERLYVADSVKGLVTLDLQGNLLATYNPYELQGALGVCVDGVGNVFVGGCGTDTVLQVSQQGDRKLAQIESQSGGSICIVVYGSRLCFDNVNSRLLVDRTVMSPCAVTVTQ